jgi:hypothetical protein
MTACPSRVAVVRRKGGSGSPPMKAETRRMSTLEDRNAFAVEGQLWAQSRWHPAALNVRSRDRVMGRPMTSLGRKRLPCVGCPLPSQPMCAATLAVRFWTNRLMTPTRSAPGIRADLK